MIRKAICTLRGVSPYSQSGFFLSERGDKETHADFEKRCWREKAHADEDGNVFIPPMAFAWCIKAASKQRGDQIPGQGKSRYTKHFNSGVLVEDRVFIGVKRDKMTPDWIHANSDGRRGSGTRVRRCFPTAASWKADVTFLVFDDAITEDIFEKTIRDAGMYIGVGMHRPQNGGYKGRFDVEKIKWQKA